MKYGCRRARAGTAASSAVSHHRRLILGIFAFVAAGLLTLNRSFLSFYDGILGQFGLLAVLAIVTAGLSWQRQLSLVEVFRRFLSPDPQSVPAQGRSR